MTLGLLVLYLENYKPKGMGLCWRSLTEFMVNMWNEDDWDEGEGERRKQLYLKLKWSDMPHRNWSKG
jgi:hypothetical protein